MLYFSVGDKVKHNFSGESGTIKDVDDSRERYKYYVEWDNVPERSDWYATEALMRIPRDPGPITLKDLGL